MSAEENLFQKYYGKKIALYGLGTETRKALLSLEEHFEIIGPPRLLQGDSKENRRYLQRAGNCPYGY